MTKEMETALNDQIREEMFSAYLYLSMSAFFHSKNLEGFANWMYIQFQEEQFHANKMFNYVIDRGGRVSLQEIKAPKIEWDSVISVFEETLEHEKYITSRINGLADIATKTSDHATTNFLQWFVNEQVEEEATVEVILEKLKMVGDQGMGLFMMDNELGQRVWAPPTTN